MAAVPRSASDGFSHEISSNDHGPLVSITTCIMMTGMLLFLVIRLALRWPWRQLLGHDDITTIVASILAVAQSIATFEAIENGLGKHTDHPDNRMLAAMEKAIYAGDILFIVAMTGSRLAIALLLRRLSSSKRQIMNVRIVATLVGIWGFASVIGIAIRPNRTQPWVFESAHATELVHAWTGVAAASVLIELILLAFPIILVWDLQMELASKLMVVIAFSLRIPISVVAILRVKSLDDALNDTTDISWSYVIPTIYTEIEMHYAIIAATIPCIRVFLKNFNTGYYGTTADQVDPTLSSSASRSYNLSTLGSRYGDSVTKPRTKRSIRGHDVELREYGGTNTNRIVHSDTAAETGSTASDRSDKIIIRKTVEVDWSHAKE